MRPLRAQGDGCALDARPAASARLWVLQYPAGRRGAPSPVAVGRQLAGLFSLRGLAAAAEVHETTAGDGGDGLAAVWTVSEPRLTVRFVDARESAALNRTFRGRPNATNVLSFPSGEPAVCSAGAVAAEFDDERVSEVAPRARPGQRLPWYLGDLVLCIDVLRDEAEAQGKSLLQHTTHLLVHGMLHLEGFDHLDDAQARVMENEERRILGALGWPDPYAVDGPRSVSGAGARSSRRQSVKARMPSQRLSVGEPVS